MASEFWSTEPGGRLPNTYVRCSVYGKKRARAWIATDGVPFIDVTCGESFELAGPLEQWEAFADVLNQAITAARTASSRESRS